EILAEIADSFAIYPESHLAVTVTHIVQFHHEFYADPLASRDLQARVVDEAIAPGLPLGRAAAHVHPVGVKVPHPRVPGWLNAGAESLVAARTFAGSTMRIGAGRVVTSDMEEMVNGRGVWIELDVQARMQPVVPRQQSSIEMRAISLAADVGHQQRPPTSPRWRVVRERHDFAVAHALPPLLHLVH